MFKINNACIVGKTDIENDSGRIQKKTSGYKEMRIYKITRF